MKTKLKIIFMIIISIILITNSNIVLLGKSEKGIHVFGEVEVGGESLSDANITLKSMDRGTEYYTVTDSNGEYEIFATATDHEDFKVFVKHKDGYEDDKWFEVKGSVSEYEVNFEFQENGNNNDDNNDASTTTKIISFFEGLWNWLISLDIWELIKCLLLLILIIFIIKLIIPNRRKERDTGPNTDNDTIILLTGNGKLRKLR